MKKIIVMCLTILCLQLQAQTEDIKKVILPNSRIIKITGHPDYPPVIWATKDGKSLQGIAVELLEIIFKEANIKAEFINVETWGRAQEEVKAGRIDMLLPPYKTDDRLAFYSYPSEPFMMDETVVFVKKGKEFKFESFNDLLKYPGVAIINDSFGNKFDEFDKKHQNITRLPTTEQCFRFVEKGRAGYIIAGLNSGAAAMAKLHMEGAYVALPKRIVVTGMYMPISLKSPWNNPELKAYIKKKMAEYNNSTTMSQLEKKYLKILRDENVSRQKHSNP